MKRIGIAFAAVFALLFGAVPAGAATPSNDLIQGAEAVWYFDSGNVATAVLIRPVQEKVLGPVSTNNAIVGVNVQVEQLYTDQATGEDVFHVFVTDPYYAPATTITVDALKGASVTATVTLYEQSGAASPLTVSVAADWTPAGDRTHIVTNVWDSTYGSASRSNQSSVPAVATATVTGDLNYGGLGEASGILAKGKSFGSMREPPIWHALSGMLAIAKAESLSTYHITDASAGWTAGDPRNTIVYLSVSQNHGRGGTSAPATTWIEVFGGYCDTTTQEYVDFYYSSDRIETPNASVDPSLQRAAVTVTFPVSGYETRTPGCDFPTGEPTVTEVGPFDFSITAAWTPTGPLVHNRVLIIEKAPDYSSRYRDSSRVRLAAASATVTSTVLNGTLSVADQALLYDETETLARK